MDSLVTTRKRGHWRTAAAVLTPILCVVGMLLALPAIAERATNQGTTGTSCAQAAALYRSAAALQNRELFDLAAAQWAALVEQFPHDPLLGKARYYRGVCLARLERFAEAEAEFAHAIAADTPLDAALLEQAYANLGLSQYRRATAADGGERAKTFDAAIATLAKQLEQFPDGPFAAQAHFYRAEACYAREDLRAAVAGYQAVVANGADQPLRAAALFGLGVTQQELGHSDVACDAFDRLLEEFPTHQLSADAHYYRGQCRAKSGDESAAMADFTRVIQCWPECPFAPDASLMLAQIQQRRGDLSAAQATLGRFLVNYREHEAAPQARLLRATVRHEMGLYAEAIVDADAFLEADAADANARADATLLRGLCEAKLNHLADAVQTFESLLRNGNQYHATDRALYELAWAYQASGQSERATATFQRLAKKHPESPLAAECFFRVGETQFNAGDFAAAAENFAAARTRASEPGLQEQAAHKLGWARFSLEQFESAEKAFNEQLTDAPQGALAADARLMIAECRFACKDYAGAMAAYTAALSDVAASDELVELGLLHAAESASQAEAWEKVAASVDRLERGFPESQRLPEGRFERGWALYHLKQFDAAQRDFAALAACDDEALAARARFMIGEIHFARREYDAAVRAFFQVAYGEGDRDMPEAVRQWQAESLFEAARCLEQTESFDAAQKLYRELAERFPESEKAPHARVAIDEWKTNKR